MIVAVVGIGLIGGSMAISLKSSGWATQLIGVDKNPANAKRALELGLVDEILTMEEALKKATVVIVSTPVNAMVKLIPSILDKMSAEQVLLDVGSTKVSILKAIQEHPNRGRYVPTHPMAGTEFSGPEAAIPNLFEGKCTVICNPDDSDEDARRIVHELYNALKMSIVEMDAKAHDIHTAYVSHISHISSFALALTVLEKEQDEKQIFQLASGGFASTVRLAKSSPDMWVPIFEQNRDNVLDVLDEHINTLAKFRSLLIKNRFEEFYQMIEKANSIKRILN